MLKHSINVLIKHLSNFNKNMYNLLFKKKSKRYVIPGDPWLFICDLTYFVTFYNIFIYIINYT